MLLLFAMQLLTAVIVLRIRPMREAYRWIVADLLLCCMWDASFIIRDTLVPLLHANETGSEGLHRLLLRSSIPLEFIGEVFNPYAGLMFAITYSELAGRRLRRAFYVVLLAPCVYMAAVTPFRPQLELDYTRMVPWVGVYYAAIFALLVFTAARAADARVRRNRILTACVCIPPLLGDYLFNQLAQAYHFGTREYRLLEAMILLSFLLFVGFAARYGVFGVRILIQKSRLDHTLRSMNSGTALLNHAMKNSLVNIELLAGRAELAQAAASDDGNGGDLARIREETQGLMAMIDRIHKQSQDFEMKKAPENIAELLSEAVEALKPRMETQSVELRLRLEAAPDILADGIHVQETFRNLLTNAMEAGAGILEVGCEAEGRWIRVRISDNGSGISKENLPLVFDPFFSTKRRSDNFGLGLSYCYMVVKKHRGHIAVSSEKGKGTTFVIRFPLGAKNPRMAGRSRNPPI